MKETLPWQLPDEEIVRNAIGSTIYVCEPIALKAYERILERLREAEGR